MSRIRWCLLCAYKRGSNRDLREVLNNMLILEVFLMVRCARMRLRLNHAMRRRRNLHGLQSTILCGIKKETEFTEVKHP